jgi:uncharacterized protein (DUF697 family)
VALDPKTNDSQNDDIKIKRSRRRLYQTDSPREQELSTDIKTESNTSITSTTAGIPDDTKETKAIAIVKKNKCWSMGVGVLPFPVFDFVALTALQMKMVRELSILYRVPFNEQKGKSIILALLGGINAVTLTGLVARSMIKIVPGIGTLLAIGSSSIIAGAATFAVGKVFVQHFELGGTLLNLNPEDVKEYFRKQYQIGEHQLKKEITKK